MRGKASAAALRHGFRGITPAYAGKRLSLMGGNPIDGDHPRLCGEKKCPKEVWNPLSGSPPPMRGKAFDANGDVTAAGITPAYAGKSF